MDKINKQIIILNTPSELKHIPVFYNTHRIEITPAYLLDILNVMLDAAQRSIKETVDLDYIINTVMKEIIYPEHYNILTEDDIGALFIIIFDALISLRTVISQFDPSILSHSLYVTRFNETMMEITYF